jgi:hypothetical protein
MNLGNPARNVDHNSESFGTPYGIFLYRPIFSHVFLKIPVTVFHIDVIVSFFPELPVTKNRNNILVTTLTQLRNGARFISNGFADFLSPNTASNDSYNLTSKILNPISAPKLNRYLLSYGIIILQRE